MKIGRGVSELWRVENRPLPLTWPMAYTTACTTVQAVIRQLIKLSAQRNKAESETKQFQNSFETVLFQFHFVERTV